QSERINLFLDNDAHLRAVTTSTSGLTSNDFVLFDDHVGAYDYESTTRIITKANSPYTPMTIPSGSSVNMKSRSEILLQNGFSALNGSSYHGFIGTELPTPPSKIAQNREIAGNGINSFYLNATSPVHNTTIIKYSVGGSIGVKIAVYDLLGNLIT